jgi:hypothetical protein
MRLLRRGTDSLRLPLRYEVSQGSSTGAVVLALALVAGAVAVASAPWVSSAPWRAAAALALVAVAAAVHGTSASGRRSTKAWLVLDECGMHELDRSGAAARATTVVGWREPFGATVFGTADRATFLIALTSPCATRLVSVRAAGHQDLACARTLLERASPLPETFRAREGAVLGASDAERLLRELARRAPAALDRVYLSDAYGEPVVLDGRELRVGGRRIDLSSPLESRAFVFQEGSMHAAVVCQATWVRQADVEVVLVSPLAAEGAWSHATVVEPPPRELRRAIDRLYMLPLRRAIDRAPRARREVSRDGLREEC